MAFSLVVYSKEKERLGEARSISSLQWLECYAGVGEAKLVCAATKNNLALLHEDVLLQNPDRPQVLARVQYVETDDDMRTAKMTVRAKLTADRLGERVLMHTAEITNAEAGALELVQKNLRGLALTVGAPKGFPQRYDGQISWESLLDAVMKITERTGLGFRVTAGKDLAECFEIYKGKDRTDPQSADYVGFFGDTARNIKKVKIVRDTANYRNVAVIAGEGDGAERVIEVLDLSDGAERRELYVNASDLTSHYTTEEPDGSTQEHTMTPEEYAAQLRERGMQALTETWVGNTFEAELGQSMMLFGKDYDLGDILPIQLERYGIKVKVRIAQITLIYEETKSIKAMMEVVT